MSSLYFPRFRRWLWQSPPGEFALSVVKKVLIGALRQGQVPRHIAFVCDGNRRYARKHQIETVAGHNMGFEAMARILDVCYQIGVEVVTLYAFSIENFKRSKYEVDALMELARTKLVQLAEHGELLDRYGASIRILGQRELLPPDVLEAIDRAVDLTKHNKRAILNICFPYTSRAEITTAIRSTVEEYSQPVISSQYKRPFSESSIKRNIRSRKLSSVEEESILRSSTPSPSEDSKGQVQDEPISHGNSVFATDSAFSSTTTLNRLSGESSPSPPLSNADPKTMVYMDAELIDANTLDRHMYTAGLPPLDLLIRTSGVGRLSDFMLWQCHEHTSIVFTDCLWPELDLWRFLPVLVEWQWWRRKNERLLESDSLKRD